jgi:large-conductance mechanosensitive channel
VSALFTQICYGEIMKKLFLFILLSFMISFLTSCSDNDKTEKPKEKSTAEIRLEKQTQDVKNCVRTLGNGVYKDKSLSWKLDSCNATN